MPDLWNGPTPDRCWVNFRGLVDSGVASADNKLLPKTVPAVSAKKFRLFIVATSENAPIGHITGSRSIL